ncbi:hypothetical protein LEMLEM_LOCUS8718 [Lemmus lemmus]
MSQPVYLAGDPETQ